MPSLKGPLRLQPYGVQTRLALSYGLVVLVTGLAVVAVLLVTLTVSLALRSPFGPAWPGVAFVQWLEPTPQGGEPAAGVSLYSTRLFTSEQLERMWTEAVIGRGVLFGGAALAMALLTALVSGYVLARRVAKPLTDMAKAASEMSAASLDRRLVYPNPRDELGQLASAFNEMLDRLQVAFDDLEQLTSHSSHEIRTSLALIKTHLELGLTEESDLRREALAALAATDRLGLWATEALSGASRTLFERPGLVDLALIAAGIVDEYGRPGRVLTLDIPPDGVPAARGHETWLRRALANLLDNALKHGPSDGPVEVKVTRRFDAVIVSVTDHGPGVPGPEQDRIWNRHGRGLGLPLVRKAVEAAGGTVWLRSRTGEGSTFYVSLPVADTAPPVATTEIAP